MDWFLFIMAIGLAYGLISLIVLVRSWIKPKTPW